MLGFKEITLEKGGRSRNENVTDTYIEMQETTRCI